MTSQLLEQAAVTWLVITCHSGQWTDCVAVKDQPQSPGYKERGKYMRYEIWGTGRRLRQRLIMRPVKQTQLSEQIEGGWAGWAGDLHPCSSSLDANLRAFSCRIHYTLFYGSNTEHLLFVHGKLWRIWRCSLLQKKMIMKGGRREKRILKWEGKKNWLHLKMSLPFDEDDFWKD